MDTLLNQQHIWYFVTQIMIIFTTGPTLETNYSTSSKTIRKYDVIVM